MTSILIEIGDIEIQIRRSTKSTQEYEKETSITTIKHPSAITYQNGVPEKQNISNDEKPTANLNYWDYSLTHGKKRQDLHLIILNTFYSNINDIFIQRENRD